MNDGSGIRRFYCTCHNRPNQWLIKYVPQVSGYRSGASSLKRHPLLIIITLNMIFIRTRNTIHCKALTSYAITSQRHFIGHVLSRALIRDGFRARSTDSEISA